MTNPFQTQNAREKLIKGLSSAEGSKMSFAEIMTALESEPELKAEFQKLTAGEISELLKTTEPTKAKVKQKFPIVHADELDAYKDSIIEVLRSYGLSGSYGLSPLQLRQALNKGSEVTMRSSLKELVEAGKIKHCGSTKGLCYHMPELHKEAVSIYEAKKAEREGKKKKKS